MQKVIAILLLVLVINQIGTSYTVLKAVEQLDKVQASIGVDINTVAKNIDKATKDVNNVTKDITKAGKDINKIANAL